MNSSQWTDLEPGDHRVPCPACGRGDRDKALGVTVEYSGKGVAHCFRCGFAEAFRPDAKTRARPAQVIERPQTSQKHANLADYGQALWSACEPVSGAALAYLHARRCLPPPTDGDLRWHPSLKHPSGTYGPALVGLITHAVTREPLSLHRTWIQSDGQKAPLEPSRLLLGNHAVKLGVIRLWPDECVTTGLAIAEGIETALSLAWAYKPVWSCIDAGHVAAMPVLPGIETLVIGADNDPAGQKAAAECARRWASAGVDVLVTRQSANDLNDVLKELVA